jgi:tetratricopeptide (TPR) repeat protein
MMIKNLLLILSLLFFSACTASYTSNGPDPQVKSFEHEDQLIISALLASRSYDTNKSIEIYEELYKKSHKPEYLFESFKYLYERKSYQTILDKVDLCLEDEPKDKALLRFKIASQNALGDVSGAKQSALYLLDVTKASQDYQRVASLYIRQEDYKTALKYLESAYAIDKNENILTNLVTLMYLKLDQKKEAIAYLESHSMQYGCGDKVCNKLLELYSDMDDKAGQISTYKRLYELTKDPQYANRLMRVYALDQDSTRLIEFLKSSGFDDELLLRIYMAERSYEESKALALKLFNQTNNPIFQAQYAISLYEGSKHLTPEVISEVIENLEDVVSQTPEPNYLNYIGYLMINHDLNISKGMQYVNRALNIEKNSGFYLDSLAWGYYKLKDCEQAKKYINEAKRILGDNEELQEHYQIIKNCK